MNGTFFNARETGQGTASDAQDAGSARRLACAEARQRMLSGKTEPFVFADWQKTLFFHYLLEPELLRPHLPGCVELDLYEGQACVSLVALTMQNFRGRSPIAPGSLFRLIRRQRFLNLRTYVHVRGEPAAFFLWGWISNPFGIALPLQKIGLPSVFADVKYAHNLESETFQGSVTEDRGTFQYRAWTEPGQVVEPCRSGSLAEFAMERYSAMFSQGSKLRLFRAWHPQWLQKKLKVVVENQALIAARFPWFEQARFAESNCGAAMADVWLDRVRQVPLVAKHHAVLSAFYEIP
jgi:uncharacterized protein